MTAVQGSDGSGGNSGESGGSGGAPGESGDDDFAAWARPGGGTGSGSGGAGSGGPGVPPTRRGGPPGWIAILAVGGIFVGVLLVVVSALGIGVRVGAPSATLAPAGNDALVTRALVASALSDSSIQVTLDPQVAYRPGESATLAKTPRLLLQAVIPSAPTSGYVVIYELPDSNAAAAAGRDFAAYLAGGTGAIQYPRDAQFVIRRLGNTLVFFPWSPTVTPDPATAMVAATLETLGVAVGGS
jgi:hypothetical protein